MASEVESNDSISYANSIQLGAVISGFLSKTNYSDIDWYKFSTNNLGSVNINFSTGFSNSSKESLHKSSTALTQAL